MPIIRAKNLYSLTQNSRRSWLHQRRSGLKPETHTYKMRGDTRMKLDIWRPKGSSKSEKRPVLVHLHGGGWVVGDRKLIEPVFLDQVKRGYIMVSIGYSLSRNAFWPAQINDTRAALDWLLEHAEREGLDMERAVYGGSSAGGQLALLAGLTGTHKPAGMIALYPPTDFIALGKKRPLVRRNLAQLFGQPMSSAPNVVREAGPVTHVKEGAPPTLLIHGTGDPMVPISQSEIFLEAMHKVGASCDLVILPNAYHTDKRLNGPEARPQFEAFLDRVTQNQTET